MTRSKTSISMTRRLRRPKTWCCEGATDETKSEWRVLSVSFLHIMNLTTLLLALFSSASAQEINGHPDLRSERETNTTTVYNTVKVITAQPGAVCPPKTTCALFPVYPPMTVYNNTVTVTTAQIYPLCPLMSTCSTCPVCPPVHCPLAATLTITA